MINLELSVDNLEQCDDLVECMMNQTEVHVTIGETHLKAFVVEYRTAPIHDRQAGLIHRTFKLRENMS